MFPFHVPFPMFAFHVPLSFTPPPPPLFLFPPPLPLFYVPFHVPFSMFPSHVLHLQASCHSSWVASSNILFSLSRLSFSQAHMIMQS